MCRLVVIFIINFIRLSLHSLLKRIIPKINYSKQNQHDKKWARIHEFYGMLYKMRDPLGHIESLLLQKVVLIELRYNLSIGMQFYCFMNLHKSYISLAYWLLEYHDYTRRIMKEFIVICNKEIVNMNFSLSISGCYKIKDI